MKSNGIVAFLCGIVALAGAGGCKKHKCSKSTPLRWRTELARVFPADVDEDGSAELIVLYGTPDGKRSFTEARASETGMRLWKTHTIPCPSTGGLTDMAHSVGRGSRLMLACEAR